jgi:hypothetical protein
MADAVPTDQDPMIVGLEGDMMGAEAGKEDHGGEMAPEQAQGGRVKLSKVAA